MQELASLPREESIALLDRIRDMENAPAGYSGSATYELAPPARGPGATGISRSLPTIQAVRSEVDGVSQLRILPSIRAGPDPNSSYEARNARGTQHSPFGDAGMRYS